MFANFIKSKQKFLENCPKDMVTRNNSIKLKNKI